MTKPPELEFEALNLAAMSTPWHKVTIDIKYFLLSSAPYTTVTFYASVNGTIQSNQRLQDVFESASSQDVALLLSPYQIFKEPPMNAEKVHSESGKEDEVRSENLLCVLIQPFRNPNDHKRLVAKWP